MRAILVGVAVVLMGGCNVPQCDAQFFECESSNALKICPIGTAVPAGCADVGTGKVDCNVVEAC